MEKPVLQTVLNFKGGKFGLRYLKIVKSPSGLHYVLDVMFKAGLRVTENVVIGNSAEQIGVGLHAQVQQYRPTGYDSIKPAIDFIAACATRALSDYSGLITEMQLDESTLRNAWEQTAFDQYLALRDPKSFWLYESILQEIEDHYAGTIVASWTVARMDLQSYDLRSKLDKQLAIQVIQERYIIAPIMES